MLGLNYLLRRAGGVFFAFGLLAVVCFAQGGVKGKVRAMNGSGIADAKVTARLNGKDVRSVRSDSKGNFTLQGLGEGVYNIVFDAAGYASGVRHGVEVKNGDVRDLGDRLILSIDRGTLVIINGSVYFKEGTSLPGAKIEVERVNADGSIEDLKSRIYTNYTGEFTFRQPPGATKFRVTAKYKNASATKDIEVGGPAVYRLAITLDISRTEK